MKLLVSIFFLCITALINAQIKETDVLFTVDDDPIMASEFIRVYNKNLDLVKDESQKDIDAYLELFINYQLKVKEARRIDLHKDSKYIREFNNYKNQLTKNFMSDSKVTDALVEEAYERTTNDVKASHILIRIDETETDTLEIYNKLMTLRERVINEGYETVQKEVHDGKTIFAEDLGYFGGFKMVYPFETAAFNTKVGEVSMPFRTRFGYHIVQVTDKRKSLGEVTVAHIMVSHKQKDSTLDPSTRIHQIYKKIQQGEKFESLAKQFSDDNSSSKKGGLLSPFTGGQLSSKEFEDVSFSLENKDDISKPFKTDFGWHIVKLIRKQAVKPFEEVKMELQNRVKRDSRSNLINSALVKSLATKYKIEKNQKSISYFESILSEDYFKSAWKAPEDFKGDEVLLTIQDSTVTNKEFLNQLMKNQRQYSNRNADIKDLVAKEYTEFYEAEVLKYHEQNLEHVNEDFAFVLKEYRDGLLLFDLMEKEVWNAATKDTVGLKQFYEDNKSSYVWKDRADAIIITSASKTNIEKVKAQLEKGIAVDTIVSNLNVGDQLNVLPTADIFEVGNQALPENFIFKEGVSEIYNHNDAFHVVMVNSVLPANTKTFEEARGKVVSDYQNYLEDKWVKGLKDRFKVEINEAVLKRIKKQIQNQ